MVRRLQLSGWEARVEVTYALRGASGSIDILAWHASTRTLLVIEVKTEISSAEVVLRKFDEKALIAASVARERFGWLAASVSHLLVIEDSSTNRRRLHAHSPLFDAALPDRGTDLRRWLAAPSGRVAGWLFSFTKHWQRCYPAPRRSTPRPTGSCIPETSRRERASG